MPKTTFEYIDVIDGDVRIRCYDEKSVEQWIDFIIYKGHVPRIEVKEKSHRLPA